MEHQEATVIGFARFFTDAGQEVNITVRQGATEVDIDNLLERLLYLANRAGDYGLYAVQSARPSVMEKRQYNAVKNYERKK